MTLDLYFHPLASYCWKALIALYENETPFEPHLIDLGNAESRAKLVALWPFAKFPVLYDRERSRMIPESTIIIEYLAQVHPGRVALVPTDPDRALDTRLQDRFYDTYVHEPMQKIVGDRLRPADKKDPVGVEEAKAKIETAYGLIETSMVSRTWTAGDSFTMADCAASPALHYANRVYPIGEKRKNTTAYLARLEARPAFARVLKEAAPYFQYFPA